ncbi:sterol desaturase family protein [Pseudomonas sp. GD03860]|uniref:sterol desaturase family protein n=1 Tax=Pseudomonas TaxID=286 RepID=UPI0023638BC3|nr:MULTISPECIES: sterol desaturase family protein [Pseudomonas]MDD2058451.1 sterol desaturase family protein [Pseudomonas putida]MDH0640447.1 sterol desaturase family protein [Pseudomonas sp. GD03860]
MTLDIKIVLSAFVLLLLMDIVSGEFKKPRMFTMNELGTSLLSILTLFAVRAGQFAAVNYLLMWLIPTGQGVLASVNPLLVFAVAILLDDYGNYWVHRLGHTLKWAWRLHKPHHTPTHLNVLATLRNNWIFYLLIPNTMSTALLYFLGATEASMAMLSLKLVILYLQHSGTRWDLWLRRAGAGRVLLNMLEKIFVLQDYHHVHHGLGRYGNASANYANLFVFWDHVHGTSMGTPHKRQDAYGLPVGVKVEPWYEQLWWPFFGLQMKSKQPAPVQLRNYSEAELASAAAVIITASGQAIAVSA